MITKKLIIAAILVLVAVLPGNRAEGADSDYRIYTTADGHPIPSEGWGQAVQSYDVVIFGEFHDNLILHRAEADLLTGIFALRSDIAVSLEMFERDTQIQLDEYLSGKLDEISFLAQSRPWSNYRGDYRPLVEFSKKHSLPVLAANIPRPLAAQYARQGTLGNISPEMRVYLPQIHSMPDGKYRQKFMDYMTKTSTDSKMPITPDKLVAFFQAQCLKDDTMAESIARYHTSHPQVLLIHYQGDFHSRGRLGVVEKLQQLNPGLRIGVITPVYVKQFADLATLARDNQGEGDIVIFLRQGP